MFGESKIHRALQKLQRHLREPVSVVHHPSYTSNWVRAEYGSPQYDEETPYNHRTVFQSEVIIEYDAPSKHTNYELAKKASKKLSRDGKKHEVWTSGNKSTHIHVLFNFNNCHNLPGMKRLIIQHYAGNTSFQGEFYEPDLALASPNHLIRAEYGVHEKTGRHKTFIEGDTQYPVRNTIPKTLWGKHNNTDYEETTETDLEEMSRSVYNSKEYKALCNPETIKKAGDGKKRVLWFLINVKRWNEEISRDKLVNWAYNWYREAGGRQYTKRDVARHVDYSLENSYTPGYTYMYDLIKELQIQHLPEQA